MGVRSRRRIDSPSEVTLNLDTTRLPRRAHGRTGGGELLTMRAHGRRFGLSPVKQRKVAPPIVIRHAAACPATRHSPAQPPPRVRNDVEMAAGSC